MFTKLGQIWPKLNYINGLHDVSRVPKAKQDRDYKPSLQDVKGSCNLKPRDLTTPAHAGKFQDFTGPDCSQKISFSSSVQYRNMNPSTFRFLLVVAGLACRVQSSYQDPPDWTPPPIPKATPLQYGNHIEQQCGVQFRRGWNYDGTCIFHSSVDQCEDGIGVRTRKRSRRPCPRDPDSLEERRKLLPIHLVNHQLILRPLSRVSMLHSSSVR